MNAPAPREYDFAGRMELSDGVAENASVESILLENIPGALNVHRSHGKNDRNGTDWFVEMPGGRFLSIDAKVRDKDFCLLGYDDLALESWSVVGRKIGWTRDKDKQTDFILWLWRETGRWCLVPFRMLCGVFSNNWEEWRQIYKTREQFTPSNEGRNGWKSECIFVPRKEVWRKIYVTYGGSKK